MESWGTHLISFLLGTATGAAGSYFATKYTDKRREKEKRKKLKRTFKKVQDIMPELVKEMKEDFNDPKSISIRELAILPNDKVLFNSRQPRFIYYEEQHSDLRGKVSILENYNFVYDVTPENTPIYRITEEFWGLVRSAK
jgi:hypothetical protein